METAFAIKTFQKKRKKKTSALNVDDGSTETSDCEWKGISARRK